MHAQCVACNIRCVIWADISRYASLENVQLAGEVCNKYIYYILCCRYVGVCLSYVKLTA